MRDWRSPAWLALWLILGPLAPVAVAADVADLWAAFRDDLTLTLQTQHFGFVERSDRDPERFRNEGLIRIKYVHTFWDSLTLLAIPTVQFDDANLHQGVIDSVTDHSERRRIFDVEEYYLEYVSRYFDIRVGKQIYNWGKADGINPSDHLSTLDLTDLVDDRDIGIFSVRANVFLGQQFILESVWSPYFTPIRLAPRGTRFSFVPADSPLRINSPDLPATTLGNSQYALRLLGFLGPVDISLIWYDGINDAPVSRPEADGSVTPIYNPIRVLGANVAFNTGKIGWRGEVGYLMTDDRRADSYVQFVTGVDYTFADIVAEHDVYVLLQYVRLEVTQSARGPSRQGISQAFTDTVTGVLRYEFNDDTELELRSTVNLDQMDYLLECQFSHKFSDALEGVLGVHIFGGDGDTFFGQFDGNDRVFVRLMYTL